MVSPNSHPDFQKKMFVSACGCSTKGLPWGVDRLLSLYRRSSSFAARRGGCRDVPGRSVTRFSCWVCHSVTFSLLWSRQYVTGHFLRGPPLRHSLGQLSSSSKTAWVGVLVRVSSRTS